MSSRMSLMSVGASYNNAVCKYNVTLRGSRHNVSGAIMQTAVTRTVMDVVTRIEAERQRTDEVECYF